MSTMPAPELISGFIPAELCLCTHRVDEEEHLLFERHPRSLNDVSVKLELCYPAPMWSSQEGSGIPVLERAVLSVSYQRKLSLAGQNP